MATHDSSTAKAHPPSDVVTRREDDELPPSTAIGRGTEVSRYLVLDSLGSGGMGRVFSAHDPELDRRVAIKVLFDGGAAPSSSGANELLREGRALASLRHPNIVAVYDLGWFRGELFIAMEYVEGQTLERWQRDPGRDGRARLQRYLQAGTALAAAHDAGVVHGDFKPHNVMVEKTGRTVVLDFGLARSISELERPPEDDEITATRGAGTPAYMAPEQHVFERPTPRSDQFSFCVALYEGFVGRRPFPQRHRVELAKAVLAGVWEPPGDDMPAWVWRAVQRGLSVDPGERFETMHDLLRALDPTRRRRRTTTVFAGGGVVVAAALGVSLTLTAPGPCDAADEQLDDVWSARIREALDRRYEGVAAWPGVRVELDEFATAWTTHWRELCEATHVEQTQSAALLDQRMACLQRDRIAVEAALDQLQRGGRPMVQRAAELDVFDRDGSRCRTRTLRGTPPPPAGPGRERYESLLETAAQQYAASTMANDATAALRRLDALDLGENVHPDVLRALEHARAEAHLQLDRPDQALAAWMRAARAADEGQDVAAFVGIASILAFLEATEFDRLDAADVWLERARSRARTVELTHGQRFTLELRAAVVARHRGDLELALESLATLLEAEGPYANADQLGTLHHNRAELHNELGQRQRALDEFREAITLRTEAFGPDHRQVGQSRVMLSRALIEDGDLDDAHREIEKAAAIFAEVEGGAPERVMAEESRAIVTAMRGDPAAAEAQMRKVIDLALETLASDDRRIATLRVNHGRMLMMLGRLDEAADEVLLGNEMDARAVGPEHDDLFEGLALLGQIELARGRPRDAERLARSAAQRAPSPELALDLELAALMSRGHGDCDAEGAQRRAHALLDAERDLVGDGGLQRHRESIEGWAASISSYPGCTESEG